MQTNNIIEISLEIETSKEHTEIISAIDDIVISSKLGASQSLCKPPN